MDLGFEAAGYETRVAVEIDEDAVKSLRRNRPHWHVIDRDVRSDSASSSEILRRAGLREGDVDVLIGGPPCQPFSKSGYWARGDSLRLNDPRSETLSAYLRVLRDVKPKAFLIENVPGLAFSAKDEGLQLLYRSVERINRDLGTRYTFSPRLVRAVEHGVPQDRQRVFIVGSRRHRLPFSTTVARCRFLPRHRRRRRYVGVVARESVKRTITISFGVGRHWRPRRGR